MNLTTEQSAACEAMVAFLKPSCQDRFFVLSGPAGTGKTYTIRALMNHIKQKLIFTAPTNKATKVLRDTFIEHKLEGGYTPTCRTIYSLLGLRMEANGEVKELAYPEDPVDLTQFAAVVVDEASMINSKLWQYVKTIAKHQRIKFLFLGDAFQLPPVGEPHSPVWKLESIIHLTKVMRHDNQILGLATRLREAMESPLPSISIESDWKDDEGVRKVQGKDFQTLISRATKENQFADPKGCKVIAWRNVTVESYNKLIREMIFPDAVGEFFPGDRIIFLEPAKCPRTKNGLATTDDEATVERMDLDFHPTHTNLKCYRILAQLDGGSPITVWKLHPDSLRDYNLRLNELSLRAKANGRFWKDYWEFKESFHNIRYGYAITAHRAQGSTYTQAFVNMSDIMLNRNRHEAFRCLYVAVTRAKKQVILT